LNVHGVNDVRQTEIYTSELVVLESCSFDVETGSKKLKTYKSPGINQIPAELMQAGGNTLRFQSHKLINFIWNEEELPYQWKEIIIVPIYKQDDEVGYDSHRGISLLPTT
jgi:hypothetical protein